MLSPVLPSPVLFPSRKAWGEREGTGSEGWGDDAPGVPSCGLGPLSCPGGGLSPYLGGPCHTPFRARVPCRTEPGTGPP